MLEIDQIIVLAVLVFIVISLYQEIFRPPTTFFIAIVILSTVGILSPHEALSGFANEQIAVIMLLLVLASIIKKTNVIDAIFNKFFKNTRTYRGFISRLMIYVAGSSAFLNNTPIVATLIPYVHEWGIKNNISPSKLLIPLSYAAILGGTATLIGTSTNLIVNGLAMDQGLESLSIFDFTYVGAPLIVIGILYLTFVGYRFLPDIKDALSSFSEKSREYVVETRISETSPLIGKTIEEADLRELGGLFLVEIIRDNHKIAPVSPDTILEDGDILFFAGQVETITDLVQGNMGFEMPQVNNVNKQDKLNVIEAVVPQNSGLVGKTVKQVHFRGRYDAAIIAIHRKGERISGKIGEIEIRPGDLLLLVAGEDFEERTKDSQNIYVISNIRELKDINIFKTTTLSGGLLLAIVCSAMGFISLFKALLILLSIVVILRFVSLSEVKNGLDLNILFIAAFAIAIGKALINTGTATLIANSFLTVFQPMGAIGVLVGIYLVTNILTELVNNAGAASIVFPIAFASATSMGIDPTPYVLAVAYGASASFITPIGYQTNLMVLGPGGYKVKDFTKVGFPLTIIYMIVSCAILSFIYNLY